MAYDWSGKSLPKYNPAVSGYGDPDAWRASFKHAMGWDEAVNRLGGEQWWQVLGVSSTASQTEIKKAYRSLAKHWHPDMWESSRLTDPEAYAQAETNFKRILAAYTVAKGK